MRFLPFAKGKKGYQFAGGGVTSDSGGSYELQPATASLLGGVKIGSGVNVTSDGTISVSSGLTISGTETPIGTVGEDVLYSRRFEVSNLGGSTWSISIPNIKEMYSYNLMQNAPYGWDKSAPSNISVYTNTRILISFSSDMYYNFVFTVFYTKNS